MAKNKVIKCNINQLRFFNIKTKATAPLSQSKNIQHALKSERHKVGKYKNILPDIMLSIIIPLVNS